MQISDRISLSLRSPGGETIDRIPPVNYVNVSMNTGAHLGIPNLLTVDIAAIFLMVITTLWSGVEYFILNKNLLNGKE